MEFRWLDYYITTAAWPQKIAQSLVLIVSIHQCQNLEQCGLPGIVHCRPGILSSGRKYSLSAEFRPVCYQHEQLLHVDNKVQKYAV